MILLETSAARLRRSVVAAVPAGLAAGALFPAVEHGVGPIAAHGLFAAAAAGVVLVVRGTRDLAGRVAAAGLLGAAGGLAAQQLAAHPQTAIASATAAAAGVGLGLGLALAPQAGSRLARLVRAVGPATGALVGAAIAAAATRALGPTSEVAVDAGLGLALTLGATAGDLVSSIVPIPSEAPGPVAAALAKLSPEGRPLVDTARAAFLRVCDAVRAPGELEAADRLEALGTARDLVLGAARSALVADELARSARSVPPAPTGEDAGPLAESRARLAAQLSRREADARAEATRAAVALSDLALALTERHGRAPEAGPDLAARARGLAFRIGAGAPTDRPVANPDAVK